MNQMTRQEASAEYNRRLVKGEYKFPKVLENKTILDILELPEFEANMGAYINEQKMTRVAVLQQREQIIKNGKYPAPEKRPCIDEVIRLGLFENVNDFTVEFAKVLTKTSKYPQSIREYVGQLGLRAYRLTMEQFICAENPDMAELIKK